MDNSKLISFNLPNTADHELAFMKDALASERRSGGGNYTSYCNEWFSKYFDGGNSILVPSCTAGLEMAALILNLQPGDEVIVPDYTFVTTANAFAIFGIKVKFVDVDKNSLCLDLDKLEASINNKTKAVVVVHYAGQSTDMGRLVELCKKNQIFLIEDAAQAINSYYKSKPLGSYGDISVFSFHETKNINSGGEGGLVQINNFDLWYSAQIIRDKGTNRIDHQSNKVDKYSWISKGSSYLMSELQAASLFAQLLDIDKMQAQRDKIWNAYNDVCNQTKKFEIYSKNKPLQRGNSHIFYICLENSRQRDLFINFALKNKIQTVFHYNSLSHSLGGRMYGYYDEEPIVSMHLENTLVRLPIHSKMTDADIDRVVDLVNKF